MAFNPKWIEGKTIAKVEMNPRPARDDDPSAVAHDPRITFTDGSSIVFFTQETDDFMYGTTILYRKKPNG